MATRPAYVWTGSDWDDIGDKRLGASVTALNTALGSKLDLAGGKILQIVRATDSTTRSTTSTVAVDVTGMSVTITPQKSDSAVIVIGSGFFQSLNTTDNVSYGVLNMADASNNTLAGSGGVFFGINGFSGSGTREFYSPFQLIGYVTPATTSAVTYKMRFRTASANATISIVNATTMGQMYAIEVSA
jgi:hypothetical protein